MRISGPTPLVSAVAAVLFSTVAAPAAAAFSPAGTIAPAGGLPTSVAGSQIGSDGELEAVLEIQDERDPSRLLRLVTDFESTYPNSEHRHLVLRLRWQAVNERGLDPQSVIEAAHAALDAQNHFLNQSGTSISDTAALDLSIQEALYYGSMADAYVALGDVGNTLINSEAGLSSVDRSRTLLDRYVEEGITDSPNARPIHDQLQLNFLGLLVQAHQDAGNADQVIEHGQQYLEVAPDDLDMLLYVSALMSQRPPSDGSLQAHLATTEGYATRALEQLRGRQDVSASHEVSLESGAHLTLGIVYAQQGKLDGAVESLARAVALDSSQRQARTILENVYYARYESLDGLDQYVRDVGAQSESRSIGPVEDSGERALAVAVTVAPTIEEGPVAMAAKTGDLTRVLALIELGEDVNAASGDGSTPLLWATYNFDTDMARALLAAGAHVDVANDYGVTPLLQASRTGDGAMAAILLDAGADPALTHPEGESPLMGAARSGSVRAVRLLIDCGADVNLPDQFQNQTALMWAAAEGHLPIVDMLLEAGADPNRQAHVTSLTGRKNTDYPSGGFTALMWAARNGAQDTVRRLVEGGANLDLRNGDGASAAMIAIYNDRFDMAATLIDLGSDVNDGSLYTAVEMRRSTTDQFAFDGSQLRPDHRNELTALDLVRLLLERGADPHRWFAGQFHSTSMPNSDRFNNTPFLRAAEAADVEALRVFVAFVSELDKIPVVPADLFCIDVATGLRALSCNPNPGRTATMLALGGGRGPSLTGGPAYIRDGNEIPYREPGSRNPEDALAVLLEAGASPDSRAPDGSTLLHQALEAGSLEMIRALAEAGVDFSQPNDDGLTALDVAEGAGGGVVPDTSSAARSQNNGARTRDGEVAELLRELMGLPPAPPPPAVSENRAGELAPPPGEPQ